MQSEPLDVETLKFRVPTCHVRSCAIIFVCEPCREAKTLNDSSTVLDDVKEPMYVVIPSSASFLRSAIVCYHNLRQGAGVAVVRDTNLICKPIDRLRRGAEGFWSIGRGEDNLS